MGSLKIGDKCYVLVRVCLKYKKDIDFITRVKGTVMGYRLLHDQYINHPQPEFEYYISILDGSTHIWKAASEIEREKNTFGREVK